MLIFEGNTCTYVSEIKLIHSKTRTHINLFFFKASSTLKSDKKIKLIGNKT